MDKENQQVFFTCERNSDYFFSSRINFCILVFLYHSFHYPCYYLKFLIVDFLHFLTALHDMRFRDSRYNQHNARMRSVRKSCSYIKNFNLFFFCSRLFSDATFYSWTITGYLAENYELAKISMVEKLISKELVNPYGLYNNSLLMGAPPHMAILPGRPIKVASYGCLSILNKSVHQAPVTGHSLSASPVISHRASRHG